MNPDIIKLTEKPRILVARTDRIGDLALSLPVFASLRATYPDAHICALTREYTRDLMHNREDVDQVISFPTNNSHIPKKHFFNIVSRLRKGKFDVAVALYLNSSIAIALALAGIPVRIGPATKMAQIALTYKVKQRRSKGTRHEADHNLDLIKPLGAKIVREARINLPSNSRRILDTRNGRPRVGIHPGHGGSSRNWPEGYYSQLVAALSKAGVEVYVTGSESERGLVEKVSKDSGANPKTYIGKNGIMELATALSELDAYVASSTGPLHIASAVGTPVVGIYCPIYVCLPERWGPIGESDTAIRPVIEPCQACDGSCDVDCMETIEIEQVKNAVLSKISRKSNGANNS